MAFQIFWKIPFKSLRAGTDYCVNIYKDGTLPSGYPLTLKGGAPPFTTQEDDNDDMFTPVRTQSGYLRIVDDGFAVNSASTPQVVSWDWKELLPSTDTDRPVTLTAGGSVVWQGYMQAQNFGGVLYGNPQTREFPVHCVLKALGASDIDGNNRELKNVAFVIKQAFDNLPCVSISNYVFQGGSAAQSWLLKLVDWQNFISASDDGIGGKYDNLRVLQDLCQFWGWCCRVCGDIVFFSFADDNGDMPGVLTLNQTQLNAMAVGTESGSVSGSFLSSEVLSGDIFASVDNNETLIRGISKAVVTADGNQSEKEVIGFAPSGVEREMKGRTPNYTEIDGGKYVVYSSDLLTFTANYVTGECRENYASFNIRSIRGNEDVNNYKDESDVIRIKKSFVSTLEDAYASLKTVFHHSFYDPSYGFLNHSSGGFRMRGKIYRKATQLDDHSEINEAIGNKEMYMRLGIGKTRATAKWFTGDGWSSSQSAFVVAIGNLDDTLYIKAPLTSGRTGFSYNSFIHTNEYGLMGQLFVEFLGSPDLSLTDGERSFDVVGFSIEFIRNTTSTEISENITTADKGAFGGSRRYRVIERAGSREYVSKTSQKTRNEWNADCIYASDNDLEFGFGVLSEPSTGVQMGKQTYGIVQQWPEQHLANRVTSFWSSSKRRIDIELRADSIPEITPRKTVTIDNASFYPIGISHEWWDDVVKLSLLQL